MRAATIDDAWRLAGAIALAPPLRTPAICVASDGGGHATLGCDALERVGLEAPALGAVLQAKLRDVLPERCPVANPVDYAGQAEEEPALVAETLDRALADDSIGGVLLAGHFGGYRQLAGPAVEAPELEAARRIGRIAQTRGKPVVIHSVYAEDDEPAIVALRSAHVPVVRSLASAAILMRGMADWAAIAAWRASRTTAPRIEVDARAAAATLSALKSGPVLEPTAYRLLETYGLPVPRCVLVRETEACRKAVESLHRPAALKVVSRAIVHKSDVGGVILNVEPAAAAEAFGRLRAVAAAAGDPDGAVLVTPMADPGTELVLGAIRDPHFGPVVMIGIGGILVEAIGDVVFGTAPLDVATAHAMLGRIKASALLDGYRGRAPVDRQRLAEFLARLSQLVSDHSDIAEIDINPALGGANGIAILDARVIVARPA